MRWYKDDSNTLDQRYRAKASPNNTEDYSFFFKIQK